ncbi:glycosyltransferase family 2 protein [Calothrix sp. UHCC 0171]|uniref:glycosyltransferase n=1 Tax=Calothrix sp. UHCC 0171 TaxID=3110245 RepID=UPI002B217614|nr:glycosyltransferase family 2 protein [Calothrix sp. UHCC 0171]MEA5569598.1 glycosyltransferase family 2 protein [Calothrix sp. UHCC 0171]
MPANSWSDNDSFSEFDALDSLLSELSVEDEELVEETFDSLSLPSRFQNRRRKAAIVLTLVWSSTIALHLISWGSLVVLGLSAIVGFHALTVVFARLKTYPEAVAEDLPFVSVMVAAKNEEAVISNLVDNLCNLNYPNGRYEVWIVDDNSSDNTGKLLTKLTQEYKNLKIFRRSPDATGGKSGALNQVLPMTKGEIVAVFDADAQVPPDLLMRVIPMFQRQQVGAVQVRKAIANQGENFWTQGQYAEMALDTFLQSHRNAIAGVPELRGNGQFVRRQALSRCGGWNEETITDDLDLTFRLHLDKWDIECIFDPFVKEEGVTTAIALWHQRNRWVEGGFQRYLDYWDLLLKNRLGSRKTLDMLVFLLSQYIMPMAIVPDFLMAIIRQRPPMLTPVTGIAMSMSVTGMFVGLARIRKDQNFKFSSYLVMLLQTIRGTIYMLHWLVVISSVTARMSVRPKRLKWVKTVHQGNGH